MADDAMVEADPRKLKQVMINLLGNALKFTPEGGTISIIEEVRLDAMTATTSGAGAAREVVIMVRDTGIGIRSDDMPRLFEKFTQFEHSLSRRHEGTGLGLALAKQLVELHGGTIRVQSKVGFGSTFSVMIPVRQDMEKG
jgi:two-component system cell cycle sensor histidine kinase PleC